MNPHTPNDPHGRTLYQQRFLHLVHTVLPQRARIHNWPVQWNHHLQRLILDTLYRDRWEMYIPGYPPYKHMTPNEILQAIRIGEALLQQPGLVEILLNESQKYRSPPPQIP